MERVETETMHRNGSVRC